MNTVLKEESYQNFISGDNELTVKEFYKRGMFATGIGDLVMNVLSDIFNVPILVISSSAQNPIIPICLTSLLSINHTMSPWMDHLLATTMQQNKESMMTIAVVSITSNSIIYATTTLCPY